MFLRHLCLCLPRRRISLLRLRPAYPDFFYLAICGFKNFKTKTFIFDNLAGLGNAARYRAHQAADSRSVTLAKAHIEKVLQTSDVNRALHNIGLVAFTDNVMRKLM